MRLFSYLFRKINTQAEIANPPYVTFSWYFIISYPIYFVIWHMANPTGYESFSLRFIVVLLCIPLVFKDHWSDRFKPYLNIYWNVMLAYSLPFLFTFLLLKNHFFYLEVLNTMSVWALSILLFDLFSFLLFFPPAVLLAVGIYHWTTPGPVVPPPDLQAILICYLSIFVSGFLFAFRKDIVKEKRKTEALHNLITTIAHEVRTPMVTIKSNAEAITEYFPELLKSHAMAKEAGVDVPFILPRVLNMLNQSAVTIGSEANALFLLVDVFLANFQQENLQNIVKEPLSAREWINSALMRYPMTSDQRNDIQLDLEHDFQLSGQKKILEYVLFNLLRNAFYYIAAANKGEISIRLIPGVTMNAVHFKDTGHGIASEKLPVIFDPYYTDRLHGTGMGLYFCKSVMQVLNGDIVCHSILGEYAEFILYFPIEV